MRSATKQARALAGAASSDAGSNLSHSGSKKVEEMDIEILRKLGELGAQELQHLNGPLVAHLQGTCDLLKKWGNREDLCNAGLYHAVYGTFAFDRKLVDLEARRSIAAIIGEEAEQIVYIYGACDRDFLYKQIGIDQRPEYRDRFTGNIFRLSPRSLADFCELTMANELEIASRSTIFRQEYGEKLSKLFGRMKSCVSDAAFEESLTKVHPL